MLQVHHALVAASRSYNQGMNTQRFTQFLDVMDALVARTASEPEILDAGEAALKALPPAGDVLIAGSLYLAGEVLRLNREFPD